MRTDVPLDVAQVFKPRVPKVAETFMEDEMDDEPFETGLRLSVTTPLTETYGHAYLQNSYTGAGAGAEIS